MNKYRQQELELKRRKPVDEGRRTKMRKEKETRERNDNVSGTNPKSTSSSLYNKPQPYESNGEGSEERSPWPRIDPQTEENVLYKTSARDPSLAPMRSTNEKKAVNWRLAGFLANEYLTRRTLLGRAWPPQDSNPKCCHGSNDESNPKSASLNQDDNESRREKERLYFTLADFLQKGDVHLPGIVNPSQLAALYRL